MIEKFETGKIITILFSFIFFLKYVGGPFHIVNIGIPLMAIYSISIFHFFISKRKFDLQPYLILIFLFLIYLFIGTFHSSAMDYGRKKTFSLFLFILMAVVSGKYVSINFNLFLKSNLIFFLLFIVAYFSFFGSFKNVITDLNPDKRLEMGGDVFNVIYASQYVGFNLINLYFLTISKNFSVKFKSLIFSTLVIVGLSIMILFGSKGPILSLILSIMIFKIIHEKYSIKKTFFLILSIIGFSVILIYPELVLTIIPDNYQPYFEKRFFDFEGYTRQERPELIKLAFSDINSKSLIFGKGTGNFGFLYSNFDNQIYPHNIFVELLYENGAFGLIIFLIILFKYIFFESFLIHKSSYRSYYIILVYFFLLGAQVSGDFSHNFALFIFLVLLFYQIKKERKLIEFFYLIKKLSWSKQDEKKENILT